MESRSQIAVAGGCDQRPELDDLLSERFVLDLNPNDVERKIRELHLLPGLQGIVIIPTAGSIAKVMSWTEYNRSPDVLYAYYLPQIVHDHNKLCLLGGADAEPGRDRATA